VIEAANMSCSSAEIECVWIGAHSCTDTGKTRHAHPQSGLDRWEVEDVKVYNCDVYEQRLKRSIEPQLALLTSVAAQVRREARQMRIRLRSCDDSKDRGMRGGGLPDVGKARVNCL
jgi:hypothetical protein